MLAAAYLAGGLLMDVAPSHDAVVRDGIARQLLAGETAGRQGLVSSACWGPLSTLAALPFVFLASGWAVPLGPLIASALFGAATIFLLEQALRMWGAGRWRWVLAAGLACNPLFVAECWNGSPATIVAALAVLATYSLASWVARRRLPDLVWFALATALLVAAGIELAPWVLAAWCCLAASEILRRADAQEREATAILAFLPGLYVAALWTLMNWLIMGDPLYFVRPLLASNRPATGGVFLSGWFMALVACLIAFMALALARAAWRRDSGGAAVSLMGLALAGGAGLLARAGLLWESSPLFGSLLPLAFLAAGHWAATGSAGSEADPRPAGAAPDSRVGLNWALSSLVACASAAMLAGWGWGTGREPRTAGPWETAGQEVANDWITPLEHHVRSPGGAVKVFVCGYESFDLLRTDPGGLFVRALDFDFDKARRDYYGQALYILVRRPVRRVGADSVYMKHRNIYIQGGRDTLYDSDWGEWRLFEIVQGTLNRRG